MKKLVTNRFKFILAGIGIVLCIPLIAMQFTSEVNWSPFDFIVAFVLLFSLGTAVEIILQRIKEINSKIAWITLALFIFFLIWAELAVGLFGTPFAGS